MTPEEQRSVSSGTLAHYERDPEGFWQGTRDHDVSQNYAALLSHIARPAPLAVLDLGCGPGRDLAYFSSLGHHAVGVDGCASFCEMARAHAGCDVLHQDFLALDLPQAHFDGVFANASLFHVPSSALPQVLVKLRDCLRPGGVLFCSNPRGPDRQGWSNGRYGCFWSLETWRTFLEAAGFTELEHYYRPAGLPRDQQPWLATVWRRR